MSLDCYPFSEPKTIGLSQQPMSVDVAYDDDLFVCNSNSHSIAVFNLKAARGADDRDCLIRELVINENVVIDQVVYSRTGDYIACVGHDDGRLSVFTIFDWRPTVGRTASEPVIKELSVLHDTNGNSNGPQTDKQSNLNCIHSCQRNGNLALSFGEVIQIHKFVGATDFRHIISLKLSLWASKVCLLENYLSITAVDHIQVLKLELVTLQLQSDNVPDPNCPSEPNLDDSNSTSVTNFSSVFNTPSASQCAGEASGSILSNRDTNTSMSFISMANQQQADLNASELANGDESANLLNDACVTWNLNTKKVVKLPTLMHNTSTELSSYHICHPLELLGPASESIACRVEARLFSGDFCQNQLEPVVLLCKQFDFDRDPVKMAYLQPIYLSAGAAAAAAAGAAGASAAAPANEQQLLLKSADHELLASVTCFVATLTNCFLYSIHGEKVYRLQTITHPDLCLDFRPDLLNVHLLTPLGLQICSTGTCDAIFRYNWSSSADLNLSFVACNRTRVLTTSGYIVLVSSCSGYSHPAATAPTATASDAAKQNPSSHQCLIEVITKPTLGELAARIIHTIKRCQSVSIRANLLSYLHANAQLALSQAWPDEAVANPPKTVGLLRDITVLLCRQLLQKKQTNAITNQKIDKTIKQLLDSSHCDLPQLMLLEEGGGGGPRQPSVTNYDSHSLTGESHDELEAEQPSKWSDYNQALVKIHLKYARFSPGLLDYLISLQRTDQQPIRRRLISCMYDYNPRLLIKFAQRFTSSPFVEQIGDMEAPEQAHTKSLLLLLADKLRQLAELDSTGINRATVLFTLAIQYEALGERRQCLASLTQIKPLHHLAITMCSNHEASHTIAAVVAEHCPEVLRLFLRRLIRRDPEAARDFCRRAQRYLDGEAAAALNKLVSDGPPDGARQIGAAGGAADGRDNASPRVEQPAGTAATTNEAAANQGRPPADDPDELETFERQLEMLAELAPLEVANALAELQANQDDCNGQNQRELEAARAYLETCIGLEESRYILRRLGENSQQ